MTSFFTYVFRFWGSRHVGNSLAGQYQTPSLPSQMNPFLETDFGLLWGPLQVLLLIVSTEIEMTEVVKMRKIYQGHPLLSRNTSGLN